MPLCTPDVSNTSVHAVQLPPVCHHKVPDGYACGNCHISSSDFYQDAMRARRCHQLSVSLRHARDPPFNSFLEHISTHEIDERELAEALPASLHISPEEVVHACVADPSTTVLCTHVEDVQAYNTKILEALYEAGVVGDVHLTPVETDVENEPGLLDWVANPRHHTLQCVALGARVMLTHNLDLSKGAANGATGVVTDITFGTSPISEELVPTRLHVRLDVSQHTIRIPRCAVYATHHEGTAYRKCMFPLMLAYAMTGHKCQGATLAGPTIIHARQVFACALLYVMLSRVTTRDNLRIVPTLTAEDFKPLRLAPCDDAARPAHRQ